MTTDERVFVMDLSPDGVGSRVELDGQDITTLLVGVEVSVGIDQPTRVRLIPSNGQRVRLTALVSRKNIAVEPNF